MLVLVPLLTDEWFGLAKWGTILGSIMLAAVLGQFVFGNVLSSVMLDVRGSHIGTFHLVFVSVAACCLLCAPALWLCERRMG